MIDNNKNILLIQTAYIGDVILSTCLIEQLTQLYPKASIDFVLRKSNASILQGHPNISKLITWDKSTNKNRNLLKVIKEIRSTKYDLVINVQRFASSGFMIWLAKGKEKIGYKKNPFSFSFNRKVRHRIEEGVHEIDRLFDLTSHLTDKRVMPKLYLPDSAFEKVKRYIKEPYIVIAPTSVWFTKEYPAEKWVEFLDQSTFEGNVYLIGAPSDFEKSENIKELTKRNNVWNLCGELKLLESAALMQSAVMNYVNDSAPSHICTAMNAPVTAIYCNTIPDFGFTPKSDGSKIVETSLSLDCRPCGLSGLKNCPKDHFKCAYTIDWRDLESSLVDTNQETEKR